MKKEYLNRKWEIPGTNCTVTFQVSKDWPDFEQFGYDGVIHNMDNDCERSFCIDSHMPLTIAIDLMGDMVKRGCLE